MQAISTYRDHSNGLVTSLSNTVFDPTNVQDSADAIAEEMGLAVDSAALLRAGGFGDFVDLASIDNEFTLVPEPSTAALMGLGLFGLAAAGRTRRR